MSVDQILIPDSFASLPTSGVNRNELIFSGLWSSAAPDIDVRGGALSALVVRPFSELMTAAQEAFADGRRQSSLSYLMSADSERIPALIDEMAANYRITRRTGTTASGKIRLVFSKPMSLAIGSGVKFTANGVQFFTSEIYTASALPELSDMSSPQTLIYRPMPDSSGYVYLDVMVNAFEEGAAGNLVRGTDIEVPDKPFLYLVRAFAAETFTGGSGNEPDDELINRMRYGLSAKVLSSRINMKTALLEAFPDIRDSLVAGAGDIEMVRDKSSVFPVSSGGYADWYVATAKQLQSTTIISDKFEVTNADAPVFRYKLELDSSDIPCIYHITGLTDAETEQPLEIISVSRWYNSEQYAGAPDIPNAEEAFFSAYQTTEIRFTGPPALRSVKVSALYMPLIKEIQDWVLERGQAPLGTDILVRGAIPTVIKFGAELTVPAGSEVDFLMLKTLVSDYINSLPLGGILAVSRLTALLQNNLPSGSFVSSPALYATTYLPSGQSDTYSTNDRLVLPWQRFTNRISVFYCDPNDVSFSSAFISEQC